jgi:hypothetical protein
MRSPSWPPSARAICTPCSSGDEELRAIGTALAAARESEQGTADC